MILTGTHPRTLDDKKRLVLPRRVRDQLGSINRLFVTPGQDQCLWLFNQEGLERLAEKLDAAPAADREVRVFRLLWFGQAEEVDVDRNGRILLPERMLQLAGLTREVVLVGNRDRLEVWDASRWQRYRSEHAPRFDAVAERVFQK